MKGEDEMTSNESNPIHQQKEEMKMINGAMVSKSPLQDEVIEISKISSKGQITIPVSIRNLLGVTEGDQLRFIYEDGVVTVEPIKLLSADELFGILNQPEDPDPFVLDLEAAKEERAREIIANNWMQQIKGE